MEFVEQRGEIEVPRGTGIPGFLKALEGILRLSRVQTVNVDARGKVHYTRFIPRGSVEEPLAIQFTEMMPYATIRNGIVEEIYAHSRNAPKSIGEMFRAVSRERLFPIAFVGGPNTTLWEWYQQTSGVDLGGISKDELYGLPFYFDRHVDDAVLLLASGYARGLDLTHAQKTFKIALPQRMVSDALDSSGDRQGRDLVTGDPPGVPTVGPAAGKSANGKDY
jgi:hypothetical protein